ncbi:pentapeptide repeat-containing protein [Streptomyces lomondensis]|nr:pentapeptide repeat-containing protein [Streptomyces lomondensis]
MRLDCSPPYAWGRQGWPEVGGRCGSSQMRQTRPQSPQPSVSPSIESLERVAFTPRDFGGDMAGASRSSHIGSTLDVIREYRRGRRNFRNTQLDNVDFSGVNLEGVTFYGASLRGANFEGANLLHAQLKGADLTNARFTHARLVVTDLIGATFRGVDFEGADFTGAHLDEADCTGASFKRARLNNSDVRGAIFRHADLEEVSLSSVNLGATDLSEFCEAKTIRQEGPSPDRRTCSGYVV